MGRQTLNPEQLSNAGNVCDDRSNAHALGTGFFLEGGMLQGPQVYGIFGCFQTCCVHFWHCDLGSS